MSFHETPKSGQSSAMPRGFPYFPSGPFVECTLFEAGESVPADGAATADVSRPVAMGGETERLDVRPAARRRRLSPQARRVIAGALPYAVCTVVGVLAGQALRSRPAAAPPPTPAAAAAVSRPAPTVAPPAPGPAPAPAAPAPAPAPVAVASARAPAAKAPASERSAASAGCLATVVLWGKRALGMSPREKVPVPCGEETVSLTHERYRPVVQKVVVQPGGAARVAERLRRPPATLVLSSSPAKAHFTVNDQDMGSGPRKLTVWRFETVRVKATLAGYEPWTKTLYLREPVTKLNAQLAGKRTGPLGGRLSR